MSTITLDKGNKVDLTKTNPGLTNLYIGLGWDASAAGTNCDLDVFAYIYRGGKFSKGLEDVLFYNNRDGFSGVELSPDNLTGEGDGDDEWIKVNLSTIDPTIDALVIGVSIHEAVARGQNFGKVKNAFIRVGPDEDAANTIVRYDLQEDYGVNNLLIMGKLYKHNGEWKFEAMGDGLEGNIAEVAAIY
jgi:tellurium resistance protein TerD